MNRLTSPLQTNNESFSTSEPAPPACDYCHGDGFVVPDLAFGQPGFGRAIPCPECGPEREKRRLLSDLQKHSGLIGRQAAIDFGHKWWHSMKPFVAWLEDQVLSPRPAGFCFVSGPYGIGKTHALVAAVNAGIERGMPSIYLQAEDFLAILRSTFDENNPDTSEAAMRRIQNAAILCLDEADIYQKRQWPEIQMRRLLDHRYSLYLHSDRPALTVVAANGALDDLPPYLISRFSDIESRHFSITDAPDMRQIRKVNHDQ